MRNTKIICTIGPASEDEATLEALCRAGMNVARLNFSHGTHEEHLERIRRIRRVRERLGLPVAIMLDTRGPEYRIKTFENGRVTLKTGDEFTFTTRDIAGDEHGVSVALDNLTQSLAVGDTILVNNGLLSFKVKSLTDTDAVCEVEEGGELSNRKSMNFPGKVISQPYLSEQDRADIRFGVENDVDFIACSFVSRREDLLAVRALLDEMNSRNIELIAKIENQAGIDNIDDICRECSGIMVARGDMGVEVPLERLPSIQKKLITKCRLLGKRVITATEMLESMIHNPRPTRAEASDVANAVYDGSSAIMLSGETAAGKYPVQTLKTMSRIAEQAESDIDYAARFRTTDFRIQSTVDAISHAACGMAIDLSARAIAVCSLSGLTVRMVSRFRPSVPVFGITTDEKTWRQLALSWGVQPMMCDRFESIDVLFYTAKQMARRSLSPKPGETMIVTGGMTRGVSGNTNLIKVETF
ncbi:MAG: pyruvate kinase [Clostridiales bacterium]|nr:pyruvate kinase [Clostridiales bacterium]